MVLWYQGSTQQMLLDSCEIFLVRYIKVGIYTQRSPTQHALCETTTLDETTLQEPHNEQEQAFAQPTFRSNVANSCIDVVTYLMLGQISYKTWPL